MRMKPKKIIVLSLGGSLIVPEEIDWKFVRNFKRIITKFIRKKYKFILITGGGKTARKYIDAGSKIGSITDEDKDWIGIHATRMNAHFIRTIFRNHAHPRINKNPHDLEDFKEFKEAVLVAAGWRPGFSTDLDAALLAKNFGIKEVINLSNIDCVYDKDPNVFKDARPQKTMSWRQFRKLVGHKWHPGMNAPFDPVASKIAEENSIKVIIINGRKLKNLDDYLNHRKFQGTTIS